MHPSIADYLQVRMDFFALVNRTVGVSGGAARQPLHGTAASGINVV